MSSAQDTILHHILIDVGFPMTLEIISNVVEALQNVLSLLCHTNEPTFTSLLSLSAINSEFEMQLKCVKCNSGIGRIISALNDVKLLARTCHKPPEREFFDALHVAYLKVIEDLKAESTSEKFWSENPDVQMCIITRKNGGGIQLNLDNQVKNGRLPRLERNLVAEISRDFSESTDSHSSCVVELHKISSSTESLQNFFKKFLFRTKDYREVVHLDLPGMSVKCDVVPMMLNPTYLPMAYQFCLKRLPNCVWNKNHATSDSDPPMERRLVIVNRLSNSGLGETQIFGEPTLIVPSSQGRFIDQNSYSENVQILRMLGNSLNANEEWLIAKLNSKPSGYFVLMPGENSFLVKPVLSAELRLPDDLNSDSGQFESQAELAELKVGRSLANLKLKDDLKDEECDSGLYSALLKLKIPKPGKERIESFNCWTPTVKAPDEDAKRKAKKKVESPVKFYKKFKNNL